MSDATSQDRNLESLMQDLVADLRPVRRLRSPWVRAAIWLGVVLGLAVALSLVANLPAIRHRLMEEPDMWLAVAGSAATAVLATGAAFQLALPDRHPAWALLPLPGLALWIGASGMGCARTWLIPASHQVTIAESTDCLRFIVGVSLPLCILIFLMLRRGYSLHPALTGGVAGLAAAAAAATLLTFFHPFDAAMTDLAVHAGAVALVVLVNRLLGGILLRSSSSPGRLDPRAKASGRGKTALDETRDR